jgi:dTDP-4-amino-4,6-dideoxygalactose transaminase
MDWGSWRLAVTLMLGQLARWLYRGQRQNGLVRVVNRAVAAVFSWGVAPNYLVALQVTGHRSGRTISLPLSPKLTGDDVDDVVGVLPSVV